MTLPEPTAPLSGLQQLLIDRRARFLRYLQMRGAGEDAEDLLQEMWQRAARGTAPVGDPTSYLFRIAENLMRDHVRERIARERREADWTAHNAPEDPPDAVRMLTARRRLAQVHEALEAVGPRAGRIVRRYRLDGLSQAEIAREEGVSISTVEKDLQKAYRMLGEVLRSFDAE